MVANVRWTCFWVFVISGLWTPDALGRDLLVGSWQTHSIRRYDGVSGAFLGDFVTPRSGGLTVPDGMAFGPDGHLYVSSSNTDAILRFHGGTGAFLGTFATAGLSRPGNLQFGPDGLLYVANKNTGSVLRFDPQNGNTLGPFASGGGLLNPVGLLWDQGFLYVSDFQGNAIRRYNAVTGAFVNTFASVPSPLILNLDLSGNLMVSSHSTSSIFRYATNGTLLGSFLLGGTVSCPVGHVFRDDGQLIVASWQNHRLLRYNGLTGAFESQFAAGNGLFLPNDLLWMPVPEPTSVWLLVGALVAYGAIRERGANGTRRVRGGERDGGDGAVADRAEVDASRAV